MERRTLLTLIGSTGASRFLTGCGSSSEGSAPPLPAPSATSPNVVVIGAGMAGLKAASDLKALGYKVIVIEARNRIGGRTHTDTSLGVPLDMGASWIHGITNNPIYQFSQQSNTETFAWDYDLSRRFDLSGANQPLSESQYENAKDGIFSAIEFLANQSPDSSIADAVNKARNERAFRGLNQTQIDYIVDASIIGEYALSADKLSIQSVLEGEDDDGGDVIPKEGYISLVEHVAQGLNIRLNQIVSEIDYRNSITKITTTSDTFEADYVVLTVPLGVLKNNSITFLPALPQSKTNAIDALKMGVLNKVYLRFPSQFWDLNLLNFDRISAPNGAFPYWVDQQRLTGEPIISAHITGDFGQALEAKSDTEIVSETMAALQSMFGSRIPDPTDFSLTRWMQDQFSFGSYSAMSVGANPSMRPDLAASVSNKLFFAGEATDTDFPATVHGAYASGERAAEQIRRIVV